MPGAASAAAAAAVAAPAILTFIPETSRSEYRTLGRRGRGRAGAPIPAPRAGEPHRRAARRRVGSHPSKTPVGAPRIVVAMSDQTIFPAYRYRDARAAINWLDQAFGFEPRMVVDGENGTIAHAELVLGDAMIMLGSIRD